MNYQTCGVRWNYPRLLTARVHREGAEQHIVVAPISLAIEGLGMHCRTDRTDFVSMRIVTTGPRARVVLVEEQDEQDEQDA